MVEIINIGLARTQSKKTQKAWLKIAYHGEGSVVYSLLFDGDELVVLPNFDKVVHLDYDIEGVHDIGNGWSCERPLGYLKISNDELGESFDFSIHNSLAAFYRARREYLNNK